MSDERVDPWLAEPSEHPRAIFKAEYRGCYFCGGKLEGAIKVLGFYAMHQSCLDDHLANPDRRTPLMQDVTILMTGMSEEHLRELREFALGLSS
jgi:hypothetical protein